jgi:hypothetical protein
LGGGMAWWRSWAAEEMGSVAATGAHLRGRRRGGREGLHHAMGVGSSAPRARTARHHCQRSSAVTCVLCQDRRPGSQPPPRFAAAAAQVHSRCPRSLSPPPCFLCAQVHSRRPGSRLPQPRFTAAAQVHGRRSPGSQSPPTFAVAAAVLSLRPGSQPPPRSRGRRRSPPPCFLCYPCYWLLRRGRIFLADKAAGFRAPWLRTRGRP